MSAFPDGKKFAFSIFDDTDYCTVERVGPVYRLLEDLGFRTTKSVWPLASVPEALVGGQSLAEEDYLKFIGRLQQGGFEIAFHGARNFHSKREVMERGIEEFRQKIGHYPRTHCNHRNNRENIYWGSDRFVSRLPRAASRVLSWYRGEPPFEGSVEGSPYFWGDLCRERIDYVRSFALEEINLLKINPTLPYHNPRRPFVRYWFTSTYGDKAPSFCRALREEEQDRLEEEGGVCIMYTHFGLRFCRNGVLDPNFVRLMSRLAGKPGWFVPVSELLDFLRSRNPRNEIGPGELRRLERKWFFQRLLRASN